MNAQQILIELTQKANFTLVILTMALLLARILPLVVVSPFLGGELVPSQVKIGLALTVAIVLFPAVSGSVHKVPLTALPYVTLLFKEIFVGLCLAFIVNMVFEAATIAGTFIDTVSGAQMAQVMVPQVKQNATLFSNLNFQVAVVLFLTLGGHHIVIAALADSFKAIPIDAYPGFGHGMWPFFDLILHSFAQMFVLAMALAGPAVIASFLTDIALGFMNRVAPQIQVYFLAMQTKPIIVATMMLIAIHLVLGRIQHDFTGMLDMLDQAIKLLT